MGVSIYNTGERDSILTQALQHRGNYEADATHEYGDVVVDGLWTMSANKTTADRPAPQPNGAPEFSVVGQTFAQADDPAVVYSGHVYTMAEAGWIKSIRVWVPELTANTNYRILIFRNYGTPQESVSSVEEPVLNENAWTTLGIGNWIVVAGEQIAIVLDSLNSGANIQVTGGWAFGGSTNSAPASQSWNKKSNNGTVRIDKTDLDSVDRSTELLGIIPNSTLNFVSTPAPTNFQTFLVTGIAIDQGTYFEYPCSLIESVGSIPSATATSLTATIPIADTTKFVQDVDFFNVQPTWANVEGLLQFNGVPQAGADNDAFGVDVEFQRAYISPDWNRIAYSAIT